MSTVESDLRAAADLARAGVRLFLAAPDPAERTGFRLPARWESGAVADPDLVLSWRPGMALCAVMGGPLDLVDLDPRNANGEPMPELPPALAVAETPSGGQHRFVLSLGLPSLDGVVPGLDYKGGDLLGNGRGFAFIAPTARVSKVDGRPYPYLWLDPPVGQVIQAHVNDARLHGDRGYDAGLRAAIRARREQRAEGRSRRVPESVALREWHSAIDRLSSDLVRWAASGWGGEAHAGLLAHTTHLARLSPFAAEEAYRACFAWARLEPDSDDLAKLESALASAVPDVVVPDADMDRQELFWAGAEVAPDRPRPAPLADPAEGAQGGAFDFCDPAELETPRPVPQAAYGALGGPQALFYAEGVHWLQGESESGKTWVALALVLEVLRAGGAVLLVDYEDSRAEVLARLRALGAEGGDVGRLAYVAGHDVAHADLVAHLAATDRDYALLAVDGVTSALTAANLSGRDEQELTAWADAVPRRARAAVCVDHVVKAPDERNGMAIGTQAKKSVVTGTAFEVRCRDKFGVGRSGALELRLQKDKRGGVRASGRSSFRVRVVCGSDGSVRLTAGATPGGGPLAELYPGESLTAAQEARARELCAALQVDGANPDHKANTLVRHLREDLNQGANRVTMLRAVHLFKHAAGKPVDVARQPLEEGGDT